jgi:endonuclease/exonuclease/phosphatase family metal-dependent hydrolase
LAAQVRHLEAQLGHRRTVVLGDFNANPFEPAITSTGGLHALGIRHVRGRVDRTVGGEPFDFFYNPTWRAYGYGPDAGGATHYFGGYNTHELFWHMLDQVVVRPEALDAHPDHQVRVLTTAGTIRLTTADGLPDVGGASDHLPTLFTWAI